MNEGLCIYRWYKIKYFFNNGGSGDKAGRPTFGGSAVRSLPGQHFHSRCVLGQDTSTTLPRVNVYDCCMFEVVVGEPVGAVWQPSFRQSAPGQLWLVS